jgi:glyoxylase-like metal-dependent hydrolase (beta-lactamase superfamily II)
MSDLCWDVGDVRITRVLENEARMPLTELLPEATPDALARHLDWLAPEFVDADGNFTLSVHALVVEASGLCILVDTCVGDQSVAGFEMLSPNPAFLDDLAAAGFPRESIDIVLCTHLHFDHVGWNTVEEGGRRVPTFPNARYLFARVEWEHWSTEQHPAFAPTLDACVRPIVEAGLADLVETDHRVCEEVRLEATPGHTPGHVAVRISSRGEAAFITGDMTHHPVQWAELDWKMMADTDTAQAAATRRRVLAEHAGQPTLVIGTHYAAPCAGRLVRAGDGGRFET